MGKIRRKNPNIKRTANSGINHYSSDATSTRDSNYQIDKTVEKTTTSKEEKDGAVGTMRIVVDGEKPFLEIKSKEGWVRSDNSSASGFSFKK
tara:strand:- start:9426 stop:9701 length:276 start_codon:yes stop_codon:yes gene_type:complete